MGVRVLRDRQQQSFVLDTSALIALIEAEPGVDRVRLLLQREHVLIPAVALIELHYITRREQGEAEADQRYALLKQTRAEMLWSIDEPTLLTAARIKATHRLSLGDAIIAAFAVVRGAVLVHKDPEYAPLQTDLSLEALPFKTKS